MPALCMSSVGEPAQESSGCRNERRRARAFPRLAGKARCAARQRNDRGRNDRMSVAKTRDEPMLQAFARSGGEPSAPVSAGGTDRDLAWTQLAQKLGI